MALRKRSLRSNSPIDERVELDPVEAAWCAIRENMLEAKKRGYNKSDLPAMVKPKEPRKYTNWLRQHRGHLTHGQKRAQAARTKYAQRGIATPQIARNQSYKKPSKPDFGDIWDTLGNTEAKY
jgi:hypothetical protein